MRLGKYLSSLTKPELEFYTENCNFTGDEYEIFKLLCKGKQINDIAIRLCMSDATINRRIKCIKYKIERVDYYGKDPNLAKDEFVH